MAWFYGSDIGSMFMKWEEFGIFSYALPFLIIFAVVFNILNTMSVFKGNKGVNAVISIAVGLMALQFDFVPVFFSEVFPRFGVGIAALMVILIFIGLFIPEGDDGKKFMKVLMVVGALIAFFVLYTTSGALGWASGYEWRDNLGEIIASVLVIGAIIAILFSGGKKGDKKAKFSLAD